MGFNETECWQQQCVMSSVEWEEHFLSCKKSFFNSPSQPNNSLLTHYFFHSCRETRPLSHNMLKKAERLTEFELRASERHDYALFAPLAAIQIQSWIFRDKVKKHTFLTCSIFHIFDMTNTKITQMVLQGLGSLRVKKKFNVTFTFWITWSCSVIDFYFSTENLKLIWQLACHAAALLP